MIKALATKPDDPETHTVEGDKWSSNLSSHSSPNTDLQKINLIS